MRTQKKYHPEEKPQTAIGIKGKYGIGKNLLCGLVGEDIMGSKHYFETSNPLDDIFGTHATQHEGKKLIFVDEMEFSIQRKVKRKRVQEKDGLLHQMICPKCKTKELFVNGGMCWD